MPKVVKKVSAPRGKKISSKGGDEQKKSANKYTLPPIKNKGYLTRCGYSTKNSSSSRHASLHKCAKLSSSQNKTSLRDGYIDIERHLNLVRNYMPGNQAVYKKMSDDIKYLQTQIRKK